MVHQGSGKAMKSITILGEVKAALKRAGTPISMNDVWIAAHTIETGAMLVSFDSHFLKVKGLRLWPEIKARAL